MSDDLGRLMQATEGEGPSPEFRARLRAQIVAETEETASDVDDDVVVVDLRSTEEAPEPARKRPRFGLLIASAAAAALLMVGLWATLSGDEESPEDITTETPDEEVDAEPVTAGNTVFDPGTFRIDTLGTPFTFSVEEQTGALVNDTATVSITALTSADADDRTITLRRTAMLPPPASPTGRLTQTVGWPATDITGWLERIDPELVTAGEPSQTTLGGFRATFVELDFACAGGTCSAGDLQADPDLPIFTSGSSYQVWVVDQGDEDPILVTVAIGADGDPAWFDMAATILSTLSFESVEPNPVTQRAAGETEIGALGGIRVRLPGPAAVTEPHPGFARLSPTDVGGDIELLTRPLDPDGFEVSSSERLLELLADEAVLVDELPSADIDGQPARVFSVQSGPFANIVVKTRDEDLARAESGWASPSFGRLWAIEHSEHGLLLVSADTSGTPDDGERLLTWTRELLTSVEFIGS